MSAMIKEYPMWCLGLEQSDAERLQNCTGANHRLVMLSEDALPTLEDVEREEPVLLWIGKTFWRRTQQESMSDMAFMDHLSRVLVLPLDCSRDDLEDALHGGFQEVLLGTEKTERIHEVLRRSLEVSNMYQDMGRMTRELLMNRELIVRKSDVFTFLQECVSAVSKAGSCTERLDAARQAFTQIMPVSSMHTVLWHALPDGTVSMNLHLDTQPEKCTDPESFSPAVKEWSDLLFSTAASLAPFPGAPFRLSINYSGNAVKAMPRLRKDNQPDTRRTLLLPLCAGGVLHGVTALLLSREYHPGRDQVLAMDAAVSHLAATLRNGEAQTAESFEALPMPYDSLPPVAVRQ